VSDDDPIVSAPGDVADNASFSNGGDDVEIKDTDIVFDCPHCGKSLAIDRRGAGMTIPCSDCGKHVEVPDLDEAEDEEADVTAPGVSSEEVASLRRRLTAAESRVRELEASIEEIGGRREILEKSRADTMFRFGLINEKAGIIREALDEINRVVKSQASAS
jgi:hypothetical protein